MILVTRGVRSIPNVAISPSPNNNLFVLQIAELINAGPVHRCFWIHGLLDEHVCLLEGLLVPHEDLLKGEGIMDEQLLCLHRIVKLPHLQFVGHPKHSRPECRGL